MKHLILFILSGFIISASLSQSNTSRLFFGKYEGIEPVLYKIAGDTSTRIDNTNKIFGKKTLTLKRNGSFLLEFPDRWPRASMVQTRSAKGYWVRVKDTLILKSYYSYADFIKVKEFKNDGNHIQVQLTYKDKEKYYPDLSVNINNKAIDTRYDPWTYFESDTVGIIQIDRRNAPRDHTWIYKTVNRNSNCFVISLIDDIQGNNFVLEEYRLLISGKKLLQIDEIFKLDENCYKAKNFR